MKTAVIYYSMSGNCEYAAEWINSEIGADLIRLEPEKAYPDSGFRKFFWGGKSAVMAEAPELEPYDVTLENYDRIVFGFPVWASNFTPPLRTFIEENKEKLGGKKIASFACQSGAGAEKAFAKLAKCIGIESIEKTAVFIDPKEKASEEKNEQILEFCKALK